MNFTILIEVPFNVITVNVSFTFCDQISKFKFLVIAKYETSVKCDQNR